MSTQWEAVLPQGKCLDRTIDTWWVSCDGRNVFRWSVGSAQTGINHGEVKWVMPSPTPKSPVQARLTDDELAWSGKEEAADDPVNRPSHYTHGGIECIDALKSVLTPQEFRGFLKGNAIKYLWRSNHKGKHDEDVSKADWYVSKLVRTTEEGDEDEQ